MFIWQVSSTLWKSIIVKNRDSWESGQSSRDKLLIKGKNGGHFENRDMPSQSALFK